MKLFIFHDWMNKNQSCSPVILVNKKIIFLNPADHFLPPYPEGFNKGCYPVGCFILMCKLIYHGSIFLFVKNRTMTTQAQGLLGRLSV
jgi:hypothetical protein